MSTQGTRSPIEMIWTAKNVPFLFRMFNASAKMTLEEADQYCPGVENATLLEIHTQEQLDFFQMERFVIEDGRRNWWLGGSDRGREGDWVWTKSLRPVGDFVWWQTEPNGGLNENCMYTTVGADCRPWLLGYCL